MSRVLALALALAAAGCSADEDDDPGQGGQDAPDAGSAGGSPDAGDRPDAGASASCDVAAADYGARGEVMEMQDAVRRNQSGSMGALKLLTVQAVVAEQPLDTVIVELWDDFGVYDQGTATTGTFTIEGDETVHDTCGVCIMIGADLDEYGVPAKVYLAQSGSVQIDSITDTFEGALSGLTFREMNPETGKPIPGGCTTALESATFSAVIQEVGNGGGGGGGGG